MSAMWERILEILRKEFSQTLRDPRRRALLIGPPLIQLIIFGYAVNLDVENTRTAWMDFDHTVESRELLADFEGSNYFEVVATPRADAEIEPLIDHGEVQAVIRVLSGFAQDIQRGLTAPVQVLVDGTNSNTASIISGYAARIIARYANSVLAAQKNALMVPRTEAAGGPLNSS